MRRGMLTLMLLALLAAAGCGGGGEQATQEAGGGEDAASHERYTVRGVINKLPAESGPDQNIYIRHAPIPDYKNQDGEVVGMMAMTMPFPLAEDVSLEGIEAGDPVEFTFTMQWEPTGRYEIVELSELPAGTEIDFGHGHHDQGDHGGHEGHAH